MMGKQALKKSSTIRCTSGSCSQLTASETVLESASKVDDISCALKDASCMMHSGTRDITVLLVSSSLGRTLAKAQRIFARFCGLTARYVIASAALA